MPQYDHDDSRALDKRTDSRKLAQERRAKLLYVGSKEDQALITAILDDLDAALDERDERVPLTYDELSNIIDALQAEMLTSKDADLQDLIDKLRQYHQRKENHGQT